MKNVCFVLSLLVLFGGFVNGALFTENFDDGNIDDWTYSEEYSGDVGTGNVDVSSGVLNIARYSEVDLWAKVCISKALDIPVDQDTEIIFDVMTIYSNVGGGSGNNNAEFPATMKLTLNTAEGERVLRFSYNYRGGSDEDIDTGYQVGIGDAPQGEWMRDESYHIYDYFPTATSISEIKMLGNGHNFESQFDNVRIVPEPLTISMLLVGMPLLRRRK